MLEPLFLNLKMERVWPAAYAHQDEANKHIADYIVNFYNRHRLHFKLGNLPPNASAQQSENKQPMVCPRKLGRDSLTSDVARAQHQADVEA
jgi:hypothetical protein